MFSRHFDNVISMIQPPTRVSFATNAMLLTKRRADLMLEKDIMGRLIVSLDAATPEMYRIMRPSCDFETVIKNIAYYTAKVRALNKEDVSRVMLNMTICKANLQDIPKLVDLAVRLGAYRVEYNHLNSGLTHMTKTVDGWDWVYTEQAKFKDPALHNKLIVEAYERAKSHGIKIMFVGTPFIGPEADTIDRSIINELCDYTDTILQKIWSGPWVCSRHKTLSPGVPTCLKPWREVVIQPKGEVRRCYFHDQARYTLGNIVETDFMEMWNSDEMIRERKQFLSNAVSKTCMASSPCIHRGRD